ncbi:MAG: HEAT repeat domain-containing protein [Planctomycetota bacterium]|nr:HEAT repeat domain-containing protein [Planctomycetota bacterium]
MRTRRMLGLKMGLLGMLALAGTGDRALSQGNYIEIDPYDSSVASLARGLKVRSDGRNHNILLALRGLGDPELRPLFQSMFSSNEPTLQIDAVLALAELGETSVDPFLLQQMEEKQRSLALMAAISLELYDEDLVKTMGEFPDLTEVEQTMLIIMGVKLGLEPDTGRLEGLLESEDRVTRMVAAVLNNDLTGRTDELEREIERYRGLSVSERILVSGALIDIASWHPMPGALAVLRAVANDPEMSRSLRLAAIDSALGCKCPDGIKLWIEATRLANSSGDRSRLGVAAIERGIVSEDWSGISDERQLNQRIAMAGRGLADETQASEAVVELMRIRHPLSIQAALGVADNLQDREAAERIWLMIMRSALTDVRLQPLMGRLYRNLSERGSEELERVIWEISQAEGQQLLKEILLTAILESGSPRSVEYASLFKDERDRTIRSLVLVVKAKSDEPLDEQELEELTLITTGGGRIDPTVRSIAGWLWLKRNDQVDKAMMEIMSDA